MTADMPDAHAIAQTRGTFSRDATAASTASIVTFPLLLATAGTESNRGVVSEPIRPVRFKTMSVTGLAKKRFTQ